MNFLRPLLIIATGILLIASSQAAEPLATRTYKVPPDYLVGYSHPTSDPADPFAPPSDKETPQLRFITATQFLKQQGVDFPEGSHALFNPLNCTLTVRNTAPNLEIVDMIIENMVRQSPRTISFTVHLVEAPDTLLLPRNQNADRSDATPHLSRLFDESAKPDSPVRILHTAFLETPSGQRAMLETVADHEYTKKLAVDAQGRTAVEDRVRKLGFRLEVDPVIEADGFTAQLKLLVQTVALPEQPPGPSPQFETGKVETELSIAGGRTRFAGAWPVAEGISHAVFFTAHIIPEQMTRSMTSTLTALPKDPLAMMEHTFVLPESLREIEPNTKHEIFTDIPVLKGIDLPPGSKAGIDKVGHLHVRTTAEMMTVVDAAVQHHLDVFPKSLAFSLEVFRASAATLRPMIIESAGHGNHSAALQKLKAAVIAGTATQEILSHIETRGGRAKLQSHLDRHLLTELTWLADHPPSLSTLHRPSGIGFEIDASIDPGSHSVPFAFVLDRHFTQPKPCFEPLGRIAIPRHDFPHARIQCSSRLIDGHTKLVAVWRPVNNSGELADDVLEAVFITSRVVRHIPDEAKQPTPWQTAEPKVTPAVGKGLHQRTFKVPKDFLTAGTVPPSEDPFAISASADIRDDRDLFTKSGISSPDGSSAIFNPTTGVLIVVNTDENLTLIESLVKQIWRQTPKISSFNLHLIEAPASIVSDLLTTSIGNADHTFALRQLFNQAASEKARVRTTLKVSAANGPATIEQVREEPFLKEIKVADHGTPETAHGVKRVGTALKLHPTLAPDGLTIDLTCSLTHHPAPPVPHTENLASAGSPPIEIPLTDFHVESYEGSLTMLSGTSRILAVWKPTGRPEFTEKDLLHIAILEARAVSAEE